MKQYFKTETKQKTFKGISECCCLSEIIVERKFK